ncbi:hypothetical protein KSF_027880 [Reticulibacter mediterranei]|uniref:Uncharacterized protein n=1 Tax=Reticulibacter mediterranei TaxID=2778369 RepID=A0A8J3N219_9CHLR|nr:hypothetical protein KSF_027880 [Reticulibacter mediterranei]
MIYYKSNKAWLSSITPFLMASYKMNFDNILNRSRPLLSIDNKVHLVQTWYNARGRVG